MEIPFVFVIIRWWIIGHGFAFVKGKVNDFVALDKSAPVPPLINKRR